MSPISPGGGRYLLGALRFFSSTHAPQTLEQDMCPVLFADWYAAENRRSVFRLLFPTSLRLCLIFPQHAYIFPSHVPQPLSLPFFPAFSPLPSCLRSTLLTSSLLSRRNRTRIEWTTGARCGRSRRTLRTACPRASKTTSGRAMASATTIGRRRGRAATQSTTSTTALGPSRARIRRTTSFRRVGTVKSSVM